MEEVSVKLRTVKREDMHNRYPLYPNIDEKVTGKGNSFDIRFDTFIEKDGYLVQVAQTFLGARADNVQNRRIELREALTNSIAKVRQFYKPSSTIIDARGNSIDIKIIDTENTKGNNED